MIECRKMSLFVIVALVAAVAPLDAAKKPATNGRHASVTWNGPGTCLKCHEAEARDVHASAHYQWEGDAPYMLDGAPVQGKWKTALNAYCVSILGNFNNSLGVPACGNCHVGLGAAPSRTASLDQLKNIDCLMCHQDGYKRKKVNGVFVPDTAAMAISMDQAVQTVHKPTRAGCLQCHGRSGGGDNYKRGDLAMVHVSISDRSRDVHMAVSGGNFTCQKCHTVSRHRIAGRGADLRETDLDVAMTCSNQSCHAGKATTGHSNESLNAHVARVACQSCHIPQFARNAPTEMFRDWAVASKNPATGAFHPHSALASNVTPAYRFWDTYNSNYSLGEVAMFDSTTGTYPTSLPSGDVADRATTTKLYPFKYKTASQPIADDGRLIPLDTSDYFKNGVLATAVAKGLANAGWGGVWGGTMATTDVLQLITHEVAPKSQALSCASCHGSGRLDFASLGYTLKQTPGEVCTQCHGLEDEQKGFYDLHNKHVKDKRIDCSMCHAFSRPERGLTVGIVKGD